MITLFKKKKKNPFDEIDALRLASNDLRLKELHKKMWKDWMGSDAFGSTKKNNRHGELAVVADLLNNPYLYGKIKIPITGECAGTILVDELGWKKKKFNIDEYQGKYVMYCENQEELFKFYDYLHKVDRKLITGRDYVEPKATLDAVGRPIKYIFFNEGMYASYMDKSYASKYTVLNFKDFDWSDFNMKETKFKVGDKVKVVRANMDDKHGYIGDVLTIRSINPNAPYKREEHYGVEEPCQWVFDVDELELELVSFTKADLKPGMVVEFRDGEKALYINGIFMSEGTWMNDTAYKWDLTYIHARKSSLDICKIYNSKAFVTTKLFDSSYMELIWERDEAKEMTVAEIEKQLGFKVKIVDGE